MRVSETSLKIKKNRNVILREAAAGSLVHLNVVNKWRSFPPLSSLVSRQNHPAVPNAVPLGGWQYFSSAHGNHGEVSMEHFHSCIAPICGLSQTLCTIGHWTDVLIRLLFEKFKLCPLLERSQTGVIDSNILRTINRTLKKRFRRPFFWTVSMITAETFLQT